MAIEYKVIQRPNPKDSTQKKYYASANITGDITLRELCKEIEQISTVNGADLQAALYALVEIISRHLANGKSVHLGDLGHFRITISSEGKDTAKEVNVYCIKDARIVFRASMEFSAMLKSLDYKKKS